MAADTKPATDNTDNAERKTRERRDEGIISGRRYRYLDVPDEVALAFSEAFSKGRFFNAKIRDAYRFIELGEEPVADEELWAL